MSNLMVILRRNTARKMRVRDVIIHLINHYSLIIIHFSLIIH